MLRTKLLLLFVLSGALLFASCSDLTNGGDDSDNGDDPIEPTATVDNPGDGATLEGDATFAVGGEAENGFTELRIFVGDEEVETVSDPSLPYEHTITTYDWDNGDYDLRAELDVAEQDTSVEASVSTTFENYMVTLETDGYIEMLNEYNEAAYMFIADPAGNVLREVELTSKSDGVMEFLPPSSLDNGAPETFSLTFADQRTSSSNRAIFDLTTTVGFQPWSHMSLSALSSSSGVSKRDMKVYMHNFEQTPLYSLFSTPNYGDIKYYTHYNSSLDTTISVTEGHEDLVINHTPDYRNVENPTPLYKWENNLTEMPDSVAYDVSSDFSEMVSHDISIPSNVSLQYYTYYMTVAPNSFDEGDLYFNGFDATNSYGDADNSTSGLEMWVPQITDRSFITYLYGTDSSNENVRYAMQTPVGDFPDEFTALDAETQINNKSMDDLQLAITGNADYVGVSVDNITESYGHRWSAYIPDSTESFVFPKIADSLDQSVNNYDRSAFSFSRVTMSDIGKIDDFAGYLDWRYGSSEMTIIEWYDKYRFLNTSSSKKRTPVMSPEKQQKLRIHNQQGLKKPESDRRNLR